MDGTGKQEVVMVILEEEGGVGGGGGGKGEVFQCQEFANTMAQGRAVDTARCNFLLCVSFVCARASLTHSYGQIEDNLWMSHIKKK